MLFRKTAILTTCALSTFSFQACTSQSPGSFRLEQQEQAFSSRVEINTKIDLLWVVDNSASMDASQEKLRKGFDSFARTYMKPDWDIRVAVITTDTYLANSRFSGYLNTVVPGSVGWQSTYINSRLSTWNNPSWNPSLLNKTTGTFDAGFKYKEMVPVWGPNYAKLLPGMHDGPITALCSEALPYFLNGITQCNIRDDRARATGTGKCLYPNTSGGESSLTECVNTLQNDTVRSGKGFISTLLPTAWDSSSWTNQLVRDFSINVTTGTTGQGSERGFESVLQLLADNENTASRFFRKDSLRGIIFVSDEEDQSLVAPTTLPSGFNPQTYYKCDQASLVSLNGSAVGNGGGYCCAGGSCTYGSQGTSCAPKTVDGLTYTISVCPRPDMLMPVASVKSQLDQFFQNLDGLSAPNNSYFVSAVVPMTAQAIQDLQAARTQNDTAVNQIKTFAVDRGDRYLELVNSVNSNGSLAMNIADEDYSPILDTIGRAIIDRKSTFTLERAPTGQEDMIVSIRHSDGSQSIVPTSEYTVTGKDVKFLNYSFVLNLSATDSIIVSYQPKTVN